MLGKREKKDDAMLIGRNLRQMTAVISLNGCHLPKKMGNFSRNATPMCVDEKRNYI